MTGKAYRVPCEPVAPGEKVADEAMCIIESMPVKSSITYPKSGAMIKEGKTLIVSHPRVPKEFEQLTFRQRRRLSIKSGTSPLRCGV